MVVSSGMQSIETMRRVYKTVKEHNQNFAILQCTSAYPLEAKDVNLRVITVRNASTSLHSLPSGGCSQVCTRSICPSQTIREKRLSPSFWF